VSRGPTLLRLARAALEESMGGPEVKVPEEPWLAEPGACFVTLKERNGALRGCIGSLEPHRPLAQDVVENARAAAYRDPRFPPLARNELDTTRLEVSLLSPMEPLEAGSEAEALARLRPGVDGVLMQWGGRRAVFIPKVWEDLPEPADFLAALQRKAGLPRGWLPGTRLSRFTAESWEEPE
jgi:AmmeMemoRadiSam system protein A